MENKAAEILRARSVYRSPRKKIQKTVDALSDSRKGLHYRMQSQNISLLESPVLAAKEFSWPFRFSASSIGTAPRHFYTRNRKELPQVPEEERVLAWLEQIAGPDPLWLWDRELDLKWPLSGIRPASEARSEGQGIDLSQLRLEMAESGSVLLPQLLSPHLCQGFQEIYNQYIQAGLWLYGDKQSPDRYWVNNDWLSRLFQFQILKTVRAIAGEKVQPTFSTVMRYEDGSELTPHKDREQAWLTLTITLSCEQQGVPMDWPFFVQHKQAPEKEKKYLISPGSAVLFAGEDLIHRRDKIPPQGQCLMMCLHFAKESFDGRRK